MWTLQGRTDKPTAGPIERRLKMTSTTPEATPFVTTRTARTIAAELGINRVYYRDAYKANATHIRRLFNSGIPGAQEAATAIAESWAAMYQADDESNPVPNYEGFDGVAFMGCLSEYPAAPLPPANDLGETDLTIEDPAGDVE
jgi:hypothetical protein